MTDKLLYKQITQPQLEIWLNDPCTRAYLQSLLFSKQRLEDVQGDGQLVDFHSMERTFTMTVENEGRKAGYMLAMSAIERLNEHELLEPPKEGESAIEMPDIENIYEAL